MAAAMESDARVVVITGASGGIGAALARRLGRDGDRLVLAARRARELEETASAVGGGPERIRTVVTDVTRRQEVERLRDAALDAFGRIDVWVNNAGRGISRPVLELTDDDLDDMMTVNVKSALYGMQAVAPHFIARGRGHLVNISSFLSRIPVAPQRSAYSAAKAALNSLTTNLRMDLRRMAPAVRVTLVMPGVVDTEFVRNAGGPGASPAGGPPPATRIGGTPVLPQTADEVADVIARILALPVAEVYTNPVQAALVQRYFANVEAFEAAAG